MAEWRAFYALHPFGEWVADQRFGELAALIANVNRDAKRRPQPYGPGEFIRWRERSENKPQKAATPEAHSELIANTLFPGAVRAGKAKKREK